MSFGKNNGDNKFKLLNIRSKRQLEGFDDGIFVPPNITSSNVTSSKVTGKAEDKSVDDLAKLLAQKNPMATVSTRKAEIIDTKTKNNIAENIITKNIIAENIITKKIINIITKTNETKNNITVDSAVFRITKKESMIPKDMIITELDQLKYLIMEERREKNAKYAIVRPEDEILDILGTGENDNINSDDDNKFAPHKQIQQDWKIWEIVKHRCPKIWEEAFADARDELIRISEILEEKEKRSIIFPPKNLLFNAFDKCPLNNVKVVIVGQDPYANRDKATGVPQATGMSFSVHKNSTVPGSLKNIYKEIARTHPGYRIPVHGDLTYWAEQGVLLLNSCLTVDSGSSGSHGILWKGFVKKIVTHIGKVNPECIYVMWGRKAQKLADDIPNKSIKIEGIHPSPMNGNKFSGCDHFRQINEYLQEQNKIPIDWAIP